MKAELKAVAVDISLTIDYFIKKGWNDYTPRFCFDVKVNKKRYGIALPVPLHETVDDEDHIRKYSELYASKLRQKIEQEEAGVDCKELYFAAYEILPVMFRHAIDIKSYSMVLIPDTKEQVDIREYIMNSLKKCKEKALKEFTPEQFNSMLDQAVSLIKQTN